MKLMPLVPMNEFCMHVEEGISSTSNPSDERDSQVIGAAAATVSCKIAGTQRIIQGMLQTNATAADILNLMRALSKFIEARPVQRADSAKRPECKRSLAVSYRILLGNGHNPLATRETARGWVGGSAVTSLASHVYARATVHAAHRDALAKLTICVRSPSAHLFDVTRLVSSTTRRAP